MKKDYSSNAGPQRKMSLSVRNRTGSGKEDRSRRGLGAKMKTQLGGEEQPMLTRNLHNNRSCFYR